MGRTSGSKKLKRLSAPEFWPIARKRFKFITKPIPGPHQADECIPLQLLLRDILGLAATGEEAEYIVAEGMVEVDGRVVKRKRFPVGLMDVVGVPRTQRFYRVLPLPGKGLYPHPIKVDEASFKLCKVLGKTSLKNGNVQVNLHDGRNLLVKVSDPKRPVEDVYKVNDVLKIGLKKGEVMEHIRFEEGVYVIVIGGRNLGNRGRLTSVTKGAATAAAMVTIETAGKGSFQTTLEYIFPVGFERSLISLPEAV